MDTGSKALLGATIFVMGLLCAVGVQAADSPVKVDILTRDDYPPYVFVENGKLTGSCTEIVEAIVKEINVEANYQIMPLARYLPAAQEGTNVAAYVVGRNPTRESQYKWVGPIGEATNHIYALAGSGIKLNSIEDAKKYVVGVILGDTRETYFLKQGFVAGQNLEKASKNELNYAKLKAGRIALMPMNDAVMRYVVKNAGDDFRTAVEPILPLDGLSEYHAQFLVFGPKTSDEVVEKFRHGLEKIKENGTYAAIEKKWNE